MQDTHDEEKILTMDRSEMTPEMIEERKRLVAEEKAKLTEKLKNGEIDSVEYNKRVVELEVPDEYVPKHKMSKKKKTLTIISVVIIMFLASIPGIMQISWRFYYQNTLTAVGVPDYSDTITPSVSEEPVQIKIEDNISEIGEYKGRKASILYKYYYDISGIVASVHDYWGFDDYATLVPRDVCIVWSSLGDLYLNHEAKFYQEGRFCHGEIVGSGMDPAEVFTYKNSFGQTAYSFTSMSNNHLIPSSKDIRNQIFGLRAGDMVRITGYLVKISYGDITLDSSTVREDSGNGACEVIYTTSVEKL